MMLYDYRIERLDFDEIFSFCSTLKCDFPFLLPGIELDLYAKKAAENAMSVSCRNSEGKLVGSILFYMNNGQYVYVTLVGVLKEFQGQHIFSKMLHLLELNALTHNYSQVFLEVAKDNSNARETYEKKGFSYNRETSLTFFMNKCLA